MQELSTLKRNINRCIAGVPLALLLATAIPAQAVPITYSFTTDTASAITPSPLTSAFAGLNVSGSFVYDSAGALLASTPSGSYYAGFSALSGTVGAYTFNDPSGLISVQNDTYRPFPTFPTLDVFQLSAETPTGSSPSFNLTGFELDGYMLLDVRLFWVELIVDGIPDFLVNNDLIGSPPLLSGRLALDFIPTQYAPVDGQSVDPTLISRVFFDGLAADPTPTPVPDTNSLSLLALGLVGLMVARRRLNPA